MVRFSGGRSSAMMTLMLLDEGRLDAGRGDVVLFNNTAAEAPATYAFVRQIRTHVEQAGIPFLSTEFATAEVLHQGRWARTPTYRLVNERPHSEANPHGFDWRGKHVRGADLMERVHAVVLQPHVHRRAQDRNDNTRAVRLDERCRRTRHNRTR